LTEPPSLRHYARYQASLGSFSGRKLGPSSERINISASQRILGDVRPSDAPENSLSLYER